MPDLNLIKIVDGNAKVSGWEMPEATVQAVTTKHLILKVPGHKYWSGRGQQSYAPAQFQVWEIVHVDDDPDPDTFRVRAHRLVYFDIRDRAPVARVSAILRGQVKSES